MFDVKTETQRKIKRAILSAYGFAEGIAETVIQHNRSIHSYIIGVKIRIPERKIAFNALI